MMKKIQNLCLRLMLPHYNVKCTKIMGLGGIEYCLMGTYDKKIGN